MPRHLLFLVTEDWYFASHRLPLAKAAVAAGWRVSVACRVQAHGEIIAATGAEPIPIGMRREGFGPMDQARSIGELTRLYRRLRPDIAHHVAMKPVLYGSFAANRAGVRGIVNAMAGLGYAFTGRSIRRRAVGGAIRLAMRALVDRAGSVLLVQNEDDRAAFVDHGIVTRERTRLIRGSGVDLSAFTPKPEPVGTPIVALPARMLADKGVPEFVAAARLLRERGVKARFVLVGGLDAANPSALTRQQVEAWVESGVVEWWGHRTDMPQVFAQASVVTLPSHREGLPKALVEAAASGRAIVTTDAPGCREVVRSGWNGLLVPVNDALALAGAIEQLLLDSSMRETMGMRGRARAAEEFDEGAVAAATLRLYEELS